MEYRVMIVEDDRGIAEALGEHLEKWGFKAIFVNDFRRVSDEFVAANPHIVLLDITLPYMNGYYWCGEIRKLSKVPIIFISSASDNMNIIMAMNMGADDFIAKPFDINVLTAKLQAHIRRAYDLSSLSPAPEHGGATLDAGGSSLIYNGSKIELSKNEYRILYTLMTRKSETVSRETLMEALWQTDEFVDDNTLTVNVGRLRRKLEGAGLGGFIVTRFGEGYALGDIKTE